MKREGRWNSRGQVTIFIIIAIVIVAIALLIYSFYPQIRSTIGGTEQNPPNYIQSCIEDTMADAVTTLSSQGGNINPENYLMYNNEKIEFLCYTTEFYRSCIVQQPMLTPHIETEIENQIKDTADKCFSSLKESYEKKGYSVDMKKGAQNVELLPKRVVASFNYTTTLTKGSDSQKYDSFSVVLNNNLYELSSIANSIIEWEALYGDADTTIYMTYYHDLKVEKILRGSGTKIYIITDRNSGNKFQFASKGQIWPAGYANQNKTV